MHHQVSEDSTKVDRDLSQIKILKVAESLLNADELKSDSKILYWIRGEDLIAMEA